MVWINSIGFSAFLEAVPVWTKSLWLIRERYFRKYCDNYETWKFNCFDFVPFYRFFFPVLDILGCDMDCRMNDTFFSIILEGVTCSKFNKIFSYFKSSTDTPYASRIFFLESWELFFFLFCHPYMAEYTLLYCYQVSLGWKLSCQNRLDQAAKDKL